MFKKALPLLVIILVVGQIATLLWLNRLVDQLGYSNSKYIGSENRVQTLRTLDARLKKVEGQTEALSSRVKFINEWMQFELDTIKDSVQFNSAYLEFNNDLLLKHTLISEDSAVLEKVLEQTASFRETFMQAKLSSEEALERFFVGGENLPVLVEDENLVKE